MIEWIGDHDRFMLLSFRDHSDNNHKILMMLEFNSKTVQSYNLYLLFGDKYTTVTDYQELIFLLNLYLDKKMDNTLTITHFIGQYDNQITECNKRTIKCKKSLAYRTKIFAKYPIDLILILTNNGTVPFIDNSNIILNGMRHIIGLILKMMKYFEFNYGIKINFNFISTNTKKTYDKYFFVSESNDRIYFYDGIVSKNIITYFPTKSNYLNITKDDLKSLLLFDPISSTDNQNFPFNKRRRIAI